jgi:hypothetical protein
MGIMRNMGGMGILRDCGGSAHVLCLSYCSKLDLLRASPFLERSVEDYRTNNPNPGIVCAIARPHIWRGTILSDQPQK